jgi:predicted dinucleotide-utilizing enzyme
MRLGIVGLGWWGQKLVHAMQGKSKDIVFTHAVTKEPHDCPVEYAKRASIRISTEIADLLANE